MEIFEEEIMWKEIEKIFLIIFYYLFCLRFPRSSDEHIWQWVAAYFSFYIKSIHWVEELCVFILIDWQKGQKCSIMCFDNKNNI